MCPLVTLYVNPFVTQFKQTLKKLKLSICILTRCLILKKYYILTLLTIIDIYNCNIFKMYIVVIRYTFVKGFPLSRSLIHSSLHIFIFCRRGVRTFHFSSLSKFQLHKTVLSTIVTELYFLA